MHTGPLLLDLARARNRPFTAFGMWTYTYRPSTPLATTTTMLQNAMDTIPPTLNEVCKSTRNGPSVQHQMWNESQSRSRPSP